MIKDNKNLLKYLGFIFISIILTYKLPHDSYSIIQYMIPAIRHNNSVTYLSGIVPLIFFIIGIKGIFNLERFKSKNKLLVFILVIAIIMPLMTKTLDALRVSYHFIRRDGLQAIDIKDSDVNIDSLDDKTVMKINIDLKSYSTRQSEFKIRIYPPKSITTYTDEEYYEFKDYYFTHGSNSTTSVEEDIVLNLTSKEVNEVYKSNWFWDDIVYELYNDKESVKIIQHGL